MGRVKSRIINRCQVLIPIDNPKAHMYYQSVVWGVSKVEVLVHLPIPEGNKEIIGVGSGNPDYWGSLRA